MKKITLATGPWMIVNQIYAKRIILPQKNEYAVYEQIFAENERGEHITYNYGSYFNSTQLNEATQLWDERNKRITADVCWNHYDTQESPEKWHLATIETIQKAEAAILTQEYAKIKSAFVPADAILTDRQKELFATRLPNSTQ